MPAKDESETVKSSNYIGKKYKQTNPVPPYGKKQTWRRAFQYYQHLQQHISGVTDV